MEENSQHRAWEQEYQTQQFLTLDTQPQSSIKTFIKWLQRDGCVAFDENILIGDTGDDFLTLDLGCGNGRNAAYIIENYRGKGIGYEVSDTALADGRKHFGALPLLLQKKSIGEEWEDVEDGSVNIALDITASPTLYSAERDVYKKELARVLHPQKGVAMVRVLTTDGDRNAKNLLSMFPGPEENTYLLPDVGLMEHVLSEEAFRKYYGDEFEILELKKATGYQRWKSKTLKRRYIVAYLRRK